MGCTYPADHFDQPSLISLTFYSPCDTRLVRGLVQVSVFLGKIPFIHYAKHIWAHSASAIFALNSCILTGLIFGPENRYHDANCRMLETLEKPRKLSTASTRPRPSDL